MIISKDNASRMLWDYADYFDEKEYDGEIGIELKSDKSADDLRKRFRGYLGFNVLMAFLSEDSVRVLKAA